VPSKNCGSCRTIAADVLTCTTFGVGLALAAFDWPAERLHPASAKAAAVSAKPVTASLRNPERLIYSISFSTYCYLDEQLSNRAPSWISLDWSTLRATEYS